MTVNKPHNEKPTKLISMLIETIIRMVNTDACILLFFTMMHNNTTTNGIQMYGT